jgi:hypothetical protein
MAPTTNLTRSSTGVRGRITVSVAYGTSAIRIGPSNHLRSYRRLAQRNNSCLM